MKIERLFRTIVAGGGVVVAGCAPATVQTTQRLVEASPTESSQAQVKSLPDPADIDCGAICDYTADPICPDPMHEDAMGCCWLMVGPQHPCCDEEFRKASAKARGAELK